MLHRTPRIRALGVVLVAAGAAPLATGGCLTRDVVHSDPTVNTVFTATVHSSAIDKVDLLFVVDNSASMGDKQAYLQQAVPDLLTRLVTPNCVDPSKGTVYGASDAEGRCAQGVIEFPAVHDMHVGVLSTSLGVRLGDQYMNGAECKPGDTLTLLDGTVLSRHNDDAAELLGRSGDHETPLADTGTSNYLNWFPNVASNTGRTPSPGAPPIADAGTLKADFQSLVKGIGTYGCGIESQLESWYRFLVQPDPYASLGVDGSGNAGWQGVDTTLLKQRHDFLRPDSLVAIIDLTDEDDSEIDVRALGGKGYQFMSTAFQPPRGTSACAENAMMTGLVDPSTCAPCTAQNASDPSCAMGPWTSIHDWGFNLNLRHLDMTQKYGEWPQFPIERYVLGLTSTTVPDRRSEYPAGATSYQGLKQTPCTNPLFAASLPDGTNTDPDALCHLPAGLRTPDFVYYAHIGGVPHQLLQQDPTNPDSPQKDALSPADWTKILGVDPERHDLSGIDPHMIESFEPRAGLAPATSTGLPDSIHGREWITDQGDDHVQAVDREYACIFDLPSPRDCSNRGDPNVAFGCDCPGLHMDGSQPSLTPAELPPLCDPTQQTRQLFAKAYPTVRELLLAKLVGKQGIVSSLCPIHVKPANADNPPDPLYGYRPAMTAIANRLGQQLASKCTPEELPVDSCGQVPCLILATLPSGSEQDCASTPGMKVPDDGTLTRYRQEQHDAWVAAGGVGSDPSSLPVCVLDQLARPPSGSGVAGCPAVAPASDFDSNGSCASSPDPGWCYVQSAGAPDAGNSCAHSIVFSHGQPPVGVTVSLLCVERSVAVLDGGSGG